MYRDVCVRTAGALSFGLLLMTAASALAQSAAVPEQAAQGHEGHEGHTAGQEYTADQHAAHEGSGLFPMQDASGTALQPENSPMYALQGAAGPWQLMVHGSAFLQYLDEGGKRGNDQAGSINWVMLMGRREALGGRVGFRSMFSLEPATIGGCGYPDMLATGEICNNEAIHDRQHPHDLFMELAGEYSRPITERLTWQVYGGPAGEPALGPTAYPHRASALPNPLAPISHHWLDSTHITFGVVTTGIAMRRWKAEASVFNGREPDDERWDFDFGPLDSYAGRVWFLPTSRWAVQVSAGHLNDAEHGSEPESHRDVSRATASLTYHRPLADNGIWATTVAWGRNSEPGAESTHAALFESAVTIRNAHTVFGRFEVAQKSADDLAVPDVEQVSRVGKLQGGYTWYLREWQGLSAGIGGTASASFVPDSLRSIYGSRVNGGFGVFLTLRPAAHKM
jgi:hypothetical protein